MKKNGSENVEIGVLSMKFSLPCFLLYEFGDLKGKFCYVKLLVKIFKVLGNLKTVLNL